MTLPSYLEMHEYEFSNWFAMTRGERTPRENYGILDRRWRLVSLRNVKAIGCFLDRGEWLELHWKGIRANDAGRGSRARRLGVVALYRNGGYTGLALGTIRELRDERVRSWRHWRNPLPG